MNNEMMICNDLRVAMVFPSLICIFSPDLGLNLQVLQRFFELKRPYDLVKNF